jgi:hypothetical protein
MLWSRPERTLPNHHRRAARPGFGLGVGGWGGNMGGPWKYTTQSSVLRCSVCGGMGYVVRWRSLQYALDILCGKCFCWSSDQGLM